MASTASMENSSQRRPGTVPGGWRRVLLRESRRSEDHEYAAALRQTLGLPDHRTFGPLLLAWAGWLTWRCLLGLLLAAVLLLLFAEVEVVSNPDGVPTTGQPSPTPRGTWSFTLAEHEVQVRLQRSEWILPALLIGVTAIRALAGLRRMQLRRRRLTTRGRPHPRTVEQALRQAIDADETARRIWLSPVQQLDALRSNSPDLESLVQQLADRDWQRRSAARLALLELGAQAIPALANGINGVYRNNPLFLIEAFLLVRWIAADTASRMGLWHRRHFCADHLSYCACYSVELHLPDGVVPEPWRSQGMPAMTVRVDYFGCRVCRNSREVLYAPGQLIVLLDQNCPQPMRTERRDVLIDWDAWHSRSRDRSDPLFDFDAVRIIAASDRQIRGLLTAVANDSDPERCYRYQTMTCSIGRNAGVDENTRRWLRRTFGRLRRAR
jgi:hypothetical protein